MVSSELQEFESIASEELVDTGYELGSSPRFSTKIVAWSRFVGFAVGAARRRVRVLGHPLGLAKKSAGREDTRS